MWWDIAIGIGLGVLTVITMVLGGRLASTKPLHRWTFYISGMLMLGLISVQTYRTAVAQSVLENTLNKIEKNTQQHTHISFESPGTRKGFPTPMPFQRPVGGLFHKGDDLSLNVPFRNAGSYPVHRGLEAAKILVSPISVHGTVFETNRNTGWSGVGVPVLPPNNGQDVYATFSGPILTQEEARQLNSGTAELCVLGFIAWIDDTGTYETDCDICMSRSAQTFNWHFGPEHNKETKR